MKILKHLQTKIIVPPLLMFLVIVILALVIGKQFFKDSMNHRVLQELTSESVRLQSNINFHIEDINKKAEFLASVEQFRNDFLSCNQIDNQDSCKDLFKRDLSALSQANTNYSFYLNDGNLVYTTSKSSFFIDEKDKQLLSMAWKNKKSIKQVTFFAGENRIVSIVPILDENKVIGLIMASKSFRQLAHQFYLPQQEEILLSDPLNRIIYQSSFDGNGFQDEDMTFKFSALKWFEFDHYYVYPLSITNVDNQVIAKTYLFFDTTEEISFLEQLIFYLLLFSIAAFIIGGLIYAYGISKTIISPIVLLREKILMVAKGEETKDLEISRKDELGDMVEAVNILINRQKTTAHFASKIGRGEYTEELSLLSDNDVLGNALIKMKENLIEAKQLEKVRQEEDNQRQWASEGLAKFAEILRQNNDSIENLGNEIIKNLVRYVGAIQGALFIMSDEENKENRVLNLTSLYAYDRKKYSDKQIKLGDGLVGTCAIEKLPIYMTDVPDDYVGITSGLGQANPRNILLVPLKIEEEVFGVIELASFDILESYKREFIEKLTESIASTLNAVKINIMTVQLLEQSQQQAEELATQEEEMRQNLEEMQATQEEMGRKETEIRSVLEALSASVFVVEFDLSGNVLDVNDKILNAFEIGSKDQIVGMNHSDFYTSENYEEEIQELWQKINQNQTVSRKVNVKLPNGKEVFLNETYSPILDQDGSIIKVLNISFEMSES